MFGEFEVVREWFRIVNGKYIQFFELNNGVILQKIHNGFLDTHKKITKDKFNDI